MSKPPERLDPSVLTSQGFIHLHGIVDEGDARHAKEHLLDSYKREHFCLIETKLLPQYTQLEPWPEDKDTLKNIESTIPSLDPLKVATAYGSLSLGSRLHKAVTSLIIKQAGLIDEIRKVFGESSELYCHLAPAARIIYPGNKVAYVPNHVDIGYNSHIQLRESPNIDKAIPPFVTVWIPLQGHASTHGGLRLYPGTFLEKTRVSNHTESLWIPELNTSEVECIPDYRIGDAIVFHPKLLHGSAPNTAQRSISVLPDSSFRISIDIRIFSEKSTTSKYYMSLQTGHFYGPLEGPCANV